MPKPCSQFPLGKFKPVIPMKNWKHWLGKILENTVHYGQCEILKCL